MENRTVRGLIVYCLWLPFLGANPALALTLYKCTGMDDKVTYQNEQPREGECKSEEIRELDPDANVIPAADPTAGAGGDQATTGNGSAGQAGAPNLPENNDPLLTGDEADAASSAGSTRVGGTTAPASATAPIAGEAAGAATAPPAATAPAAIVGP